jgi:hypothetical protein
MEWIREHLKVIGLVVILAMAFPFLMTLFGVVRW